MRHEIVVEASAERAFRVFTEQLDGIKPRDHNLLDGRDRRRPSWSRAPAAGSTTAAPTAAECEWATVLAFEPPERVVFSWNISAQWQLEPDADRRSEVEVSFAAEGPERTRVAIEHRHLDRHGDGWEGMRDGVAAENGWSLYLSRFADLI